jgi:O-antigen ligase
MKLLYSQDARSVPILRVVGNAALGFDECIAEMIRSEQFTSALLSFLEHPIKSVRNEALWALSNLTYGRTKYSDHMLQGHPQIVDLLVDTMRLEPFELRCEVT